MRGAVRPVIGVTCDVGPHARSGRAMGSVALAYQECIVRAGGVPVVLPPLVECVRDHVALCDAFVFTGGDDPRMEEFGEPTHPKATPMDPRRQAYEVALLRMLEKSKPDAPVLGVCLGMQMLSLVSGGRLEQHLPDVLESHADHFAHEHRVVPSVSEVDRGMCGLDIELRGLVASHHRQAVSDTGRLVVLARSHDGVIEAVGDPGRPFCVGVQWHPERTTDAAVGQRVFDRLIAAAVGRK